MSLCTATRHNGMPCKAQPMAGATVCRVHGGAAPQVIAAARRRILGVYDQAAARLATIALGKKTKHGDAIVALRELMTRAETLALRSEGKGGDDGGQLLWDEFMLRIRRVPVTPDE